MEFLQKLRARYGGISNFLNRLSKNFGSTETKKSPPVKPPDLNYYRKNYGSTKIKIPSQEKIFDTAEIKKSPPIVIPQEIIQPNKFSPVNIADRKTWLELRDTVLDLHELKNFFAGRQDSQSPQFLNLLENYKVNAEKKLATPADFDESTSYLFVEALAGVIKKRFYTILKSYTAGLRGKGKEPVAYYAEIQTRVEKYFAAIGLKSANVEKKADFKKWVEHFEPVTTPAPFEHLHNKIAEVSVQPRYFEYYNDDGEIEKFWIDGECTVYKKQEAK